MEHSWTARLWRLVPAPGWPVRVLVLLLAVGLVLLAGRGIGRFALLPLLLILGWVALDVAFSASLMHAYQALARKWQALLRPYPFPRGPRIEWTEQRGPTPLAWCVIGPLADGFGGHVARTRMILQSLPRLGASVEITAGFAPSGGGLAVAAFRGERELRAVVPWGHDGGRVDEFLDGYTVERVRDLARLAGNAGLRILVTQDRVIVDVGRVLRRTSQLDAVVATCLAIRDRARELAQGGSVAFVRARASAAQPPPADLLPTCPVCAVALGHARQARCQKCAATHHADCFEWTGRCGVFGCEGATAA